MQFHTDNGSGAENKLQRNSIKIRNGMYGFIPISDIFHIYIKFYHRFITDYKGPLPINSKIKKITPCKEINSSLH